MTSRQPARSGCSSREKPASSSGRSCGRAGGNGEGGFERVAHGVGVEVDLAGHRLDRGRFAACVVVGCHRGVGVEVGGADGRHDSPVELRLDGRRVLTPNQAAVHGAVEDLVGRAEVLANLVRLANHVLEEAQVSIGRAGEVMHRHIAGLAVSVDPAVALLEPRGVPGTVVVQQVAGGAVQVESL